MGVKRLVTVAVLVAALVLAAGTALAWHAPVEGVPAAFAQGDVRGYFIWHDGDGMHMRVHTKMFALAFSGTIKTDGHFTAVHGKKLEYGDHYWLSNNKQVIHFKFHTAGAVDGLDFKVMGGNHLVFSLMLDGVQANPNEIFLGHEGWRPSSSHFTLRR